MRVEGGKRECMVDGVQGYELTIWWFQLWTKAGISGGLNLGKRREKVGDSILVKSGKKWGIQFWSKAGKSGGCNFG